MRIREFLCALMSVAVFAACDGDSTGPDRDAIVDDLPQVGFGEMIVRIEGVDYKLGVLGVEADVPGSDTLDVIGLFAAATEDAMATFWFAAPGAGFKTISYTLQEVGSLVELINGNLTSLDRPVAVFVVGDDEEGTGTAYAATRGTITVDSVNADPSGMFGGVVFGTVAMKAAVFELEGEEMIATGRTVDVAAAFAAPYVRETMGFISFELSGGPFQGAVVVTTGEVAELDDGNLLVGFESWFEGADFWGFSSIEVRIENPGPGTFGLQVVEDGVETTGSHAIGYLSIANDAGDVRSLDAYGLGGTVTIKHYQPRPSASWEVAYLEGTATIPLALYEYDSGVDAMVPTGETIAVEAAFVLLFDRDEDIFLAPRRPELARRASPAGRFADGVLERVRRSPLAGVR